MPQDINEKLKQIRREAEERDAQREAQKFGVPYIDLVKSPIQIAALKLIDEKEAGKLKVAPFQYRARKLAMAVMNPEDPAVKELIKNLEGEKNEVRLFVCSLSSLEYAWSYYKFVSKTTGDISGKVVIDVDRFARLYEELNTLKKVQDEIRAFDFKTTPTTNLIEIIMAGALKNRASDIHLEAEEHGAKFRYRIDGSLQDVILDFSEKLYPFLVSRIKLLSNLKLNIKDVPQDGRFTVSLQNKEIEMRVSLIPSEFGETIVMRILDPDNLKVNMEDLGLRTDDMEIIKKELDRPNGMILNTGPTGSGKTTTLYTFLLYKRHPSVKIITIEDPVEYHLDGIEQTQTDKDAGYTFASGLRSMMRQDPDVILVGEIRDLETAEIGVQAALTGHLVFSTVHANSASGAIPRLLDLGVKAVSIAPALNLVIAQRLVRRLCKECKIPEKIAPDLEKKIRNYITNLPERVDRDSYKELIMYKPGGCEDCNMTGYKGRVAVFGLLQMTKAIEAVVKSDVSVSQLQDEANKQGMVHMQQDGMLKVFTGITTFDEVEDATGPLQW